MAPSNVAANLCKNCNTRPVFVENGRAHDFCGRRCAGEFMKKGGQAGVPSPMQVSSSQSGQPVQALAASLMTDPALGIPSPLSPPINTAAGVPAPADNGGIPCALSNCNRPAFTGSQFCGQKHREQAVRLGEVEACLLCSKYPKNVINNKLSDFCSRQCGQDTIRSAPVILPLQENSAIFRDIQQQFQTQWKHTPTPPTIHKIWKIFCDKKITDRFWQYRLSVERQSGIPSRNSRRRWHRTSRMCQLGDADNHKDFCKLTGCSICRIIETSFQLTRAGKATNFGRFGSGIYTSATSSKAHDYVREQGGSKYRSMILSDVVMGKTIKLTQSNQNLIEPPKGYDSVVGEPGGDLNYDEAIVYKDEAIRPLFLILYIP